MFKPGDKIRFVKHLYYDSALVIDDVYEVEYTLWDTHLRVRGCMLWLAVDSFEPIYLESEQPSPTQAFFD